MQNNVLKINPYIRTNTFKYLRANFTDKKKDAPRTSNKMKCWYNISTSSNIDRILSMFQQKTQIVCHVVVPIHNDCHVVMLDVFLPCAKRPNGEVTIYDYLDTE